MINLVALAAREQERTGCRTGQAARTASGKPYQPTRWRLDQVGVGAIALNAGAATTASLSTPGVPRAS
jgi:hypothetical protein